MNRQSEERSGTGRVFRDGKRVNFLIRKQPIKSLTNLERIALARASRRTIANPTGLSENLGPIQKNPELITKGAISPA